MMGSGQTYMEKARRQLNEAESKIKKALGHIKQQRNQTKTERVRKSIPQIALVGYTNAGKGLFYTPVLHCSKQLNKLIGYKALSSY